MIWTPNFRKVATLAIATSLAVTTALPITAAEAGSRDRNWKGHGNKVVVIKKKHKKQRKHYSHRKHRGSGGGDALAAGIVGLAVGAIIADQFSRPRQPEVVYVQPQPTYVAPQPVYRQPLSNVYSNSQPHVITYENSVGATYEPWTPEWRAWCDANYRSFNQNTGTYRGYDGLDHFCVVK